MSTSFTVKVEGLAELDARIAKLGSLELHDLLEAVGAEVESQTRRRIEFERTSPDGKAWPEWSEDYAKTRHSNQSLLLSTGDLLDSIQYGVDSDGVRVGSNQVYAATHQFGRGAIKERPFLGLSDENLDDIERVVADFIEGAIT